MRTPSAIEGEGGAITENQARAKNRMLQVRDQMAQLAAENGFKVSPGIANGLLPTPTVVDMGGNKTPEEWEAWTDEQRAKHANGNGHGASLNIEAVKLMPTPNTMDMLPRRSDEALARARSKGGSSNLKDAEIVRNPSDTIDWGKFAPAIERWETITGRVAPAPTKPDGKDNAHRLSSKFTEWMMGLPDGWITDVGLSRNEELKACGNGVVPAQAELALRLILSNMTDWQV